MQIIGSEILYIMRSTRIDFGGISHDTCESKVMEKFAWTRSFEQSDTVMMTIVKKSKKKC